MNLLSKLAMLGVVIFGLILVSGCGARPKITYYLIYPAAGQSRVSESEEDQVRALLDSVAVAYRMPKTKPSDEGIIRYYQPTADLTVAFYAKRENGRMAVHLKPLSPGFERREYYQEFRQSLADTLSRGFPGRVAVMTEP